MAAMVTAGKAKSPIKYEFSWKCEGIKLKFCLSFCFLFFRRPIPGYLEEQMNTRDTVCRAISRSLGCVSEKVSRQWVLNPTDCLRFMLLWELSLQWWHLWISHEPDPTDKFYITPIFFSFSFCFAANLQLFFPLICFQHSN